MGYYRKMTFVFLILPFIYLIGILNIYNINSKSNLGIFFAHTYYLPMVFSILLFSFPLNQIGNRYYKFLTTLPIKPKHIFFIIFTNLIVNNVITTAIIIIYDCNKNDINNASLQFEFLIIRNLILAILFQTFFVMFEMKNPTYGHFFSGVAYWFLTFFAFAFLLLLDTLIIPSLNLIFPFFPFLNSILFIIICFVLGVTESVIVPNSFEIAVKRIKE